MNENYDQWNQHNAAELARLADTPRQRVPSMASEWAPTSDDVFVAADFQRDKKPKNFKAYRRNLGKGDKISCGPIRTPDEVEGLSRWDVRHHFHGGNVVRPFDEAHMEAAAHCGGNMLHLVPVDFYPLKMEQPKYPGAIMNKPENNGFQHVPPPNHGHGAACKHSPVSEFPCPWCVGWGRIICDDERAGRVSPSHAAGGYAEWQRRNPDATSGSSTYRVMPGTPLAEIYATR